MKPILLLLALLGMGCSYEPISHSPCGTNGFTIRRVKGLMKIEQTHCIPCSSASTPESRFVCFGEKL